MNDANWNPLAVGTHYLNLDAVGARYACPKSMLVSTTNSAEKTPQTANTAVSVPVSTPKAEPNAKPVPTFKVGDKVRPLRKVDYDGRHLRQYDDCYTITQINGDRAVLTARGQIWAAMNTRDIEKC